MLDSLKRLAENTINLDVNTVSVSVFAIPKIKQFIIRLNRIEQLYKEGLDVDDNVIGTYSYTTALLNGEESYIFNGLVSRKEVGEPYTLYDSGVFYDSFRVDIKKDGFVIVANTSKEDGDLVDKFGEILGLTENSKYELGQKMLPILRESIRRSILNEVL